MLPSEETPQVFGGGSDIPIQSAISTIGLYQDPQTSGSTVTGDGSENDRPHRHIDDTFIMAETKDQVEALVYLLECLYQQKEVGTDPSTNNGFPGFHSGLCVNTDELACREQFMQKYGN